MGARYVPAAFSRFCSARWCSTRCSGLTSMNCEPVSSTALLSPTLPTVSNQSVMMATVRVQPAVGQQAPRHNSSREGVIGKCGNPDHVPLMTYAGPLHPPGPLHCTHQVCDNRYRRCPLCIWINNTMYPLTSLCSARCSLSETAYFGTSKQRDLRPQAVSAQLQMTHNPCRSISGC